MKKTLFLLLVCLLGSRLIAQTTVSVGEVSSCCNASGVVVDVPVIATNFTFIGGFTYYVTYGAGLSYQSIEGIHPDISASGFFVANGMSNPTTQVGITFISFPDTINILNDTLFSIRFTYTCNAGPVSPLNFNLSFPTQSQTFDPDGNLVAGVNYTSGSITKLSLGTVGAINGSSTVCAGQQTVPYSVSNVANATTYTWSVPPGAVIVSGQGSSAISVNFANTSTSGNVSVVASDACGNTNTNTKAITLSPLPSGTGTITGTSPVCQGTTHTFSVSGVNSATGYNWLLPSGASITGGSGTNTITVAFNNTAVSGNITVQGQNTCGLQYTANTPYALTVNPMPIANAGPDQGVTIGMPTTLSGSASGGSGNYSYLWSPAGMLQGSIANIQNPTTVNLTEAIVFTLTVTDLTTGCVSTPDQMQINILGIPLSITSVSATPAAICLGQTSQLLVVPANGTGTYTYTWSPAGSLQGSNTIANPVANPVATTTYSVTVFDGNASVITTVTLTVNPLPNASAGSNTPICAGATLNLTASGGSTYAWSGPNSFTSDIANPSIPNATVAASGNYTVTVTSALGCTKTASTTVVVNPLPTPAAGSNAPFCSGNNLILTSSGGTTYLWNGPQAFTSGSQNPILPNAGVINSGTYTVTVTNSFGCQATTSTEVEIYPLPLPTATNTGPLCTGATLTLNAGGGTSYSWVGPNGFVSSMQNPVITNIPVAGGGTYTVVVTDGNTCQATTTTTVIVHALPTPVVSNSGPLCVGDNLQLNASGGVSYAWSGPALFSSIDQNPIINDVNLLNAGTYTVTVTNANNCAASGTTTLVVHALPVPVVGSNSPVCSGATLSFNASGGTSYQWNGPNAFTASGQTSSIVNATSLASGTYTVMVTDANGCSEQGSIEATVWDLPVPVALSNSPVCAGGSLELEANGGNVYVWTGPNGFTSPLQSPIIDPAGLNAGGTYQVTVTDGNNCSSTTSITVTIHSLPVPLASSNSPVCDGNLLSLGVNAYSAYSWSGPDGFSSALQHPEIDPAGLNAAGVYTVTVTDMNGCKNSTTTTVVIHALPNPTANSNSPRCSGESVIFTAGGGTSYIWSGPDGFSSPQQNPELINASLTANGVYTVTVTDINGCQNSTTTTVVVYALPVPSISSNSPVCAGGTLLLNAGGGTAYLWSGPNSFSSALANPSIVNVSIASSGVYHVTVTDEHSCSSSTSTTVTIHSLPVPSISSNAPICAGASLQLNAGGGTQYAWNGPNTFSSTLQNPSIPNAQPNASGTYIVTVTDANECSAFTSINVNVHPLPVANAGPDSTINNGTSLVLTGSASGGSGGYQYNWSPSAMLINANIQNPQTVILSNVTTYTLTVTNPGTGCQSIPDQVVISITGGALAVNLTASPQEICLGFSTTLSANASGGSTQYTYTWASDPEGFTSSDPSVNVSPTVSTKYYVSVFDGFLTVIDSVVVSVFELPIAAVSSPDPDICANTILQLQGSGSGGNGTVTTYQWTGPNSFNSGEQNPFISNALPSNSGTYSLTVTDDNGCSSVNTASLAITVFPRPTASASASTTATCANNPVTLTGGVSGGTGPYQYAWSGPDGFSSLLQSPVLSNPQTIASGVYTLTVTDANNCSSQNTASATLTIYPRPTAIANALDPEICANLPINLLGSGTGGTGTYSYSWSGPSYTASVSNPTIPNAQPAQSGNYSLTVTDINNCASVNTAVIAIIVNPRPTAAATATPNALCENESFQLNGSGSGGSGPYTFAWSGPDSYNSGQQSPSISNALEVNEGTYSLIVTDIEGCASSAAATVFVTINPRPTAQATVTLTPVCTNNSINLHGTGSGGTGATYTYLWSGPNTFSSTQSNPVITNAQINATGVYSLTVTDNIGCASSVASTVSVLVNPRPTAIASVVQSPLCANLSVSLNGNAGGGSTSNYTYSWTGPAFSSNLQSPTIPNAQVTNSGTYTLVVSDGNCSSVNTATVNVTVWPRPTAIANALANSMCSNNPINLIGGGSGGSPVYTYLWSGPGVFSSSLQNPVINNAQTSQTGVYSLTITDQNSCSSTNTATINITVFGRPTALASSATQTICANQTIQLNGFGVLGTSPYTYTWNGPGSYSSPNQNPSIPNAQPIHSGTYTLVVKDVNQCTSTNTASVTITVNPRPTAIASALQPAICANNTLYLIGNGSGGNNSNYTFNWSGPSLFSSGVQNPTIPNAQPNNSGNYSLTVTDANNCSSTNTAIIPITVYPLPVANAGTSITTYNGAIVTLNGSGTGGSGQYSYSWSPVGSLQNSNIANPTTISLSSTTIFTLTITDLTTQCQSLPSQVTITITGGQLAVTVLSNPEEICFGDQTSVLASASGGSGVYTYTWTSAPAGFSSNESNPTVSPTQTTEYFVTVSDGPSTVTGSTTVTVFALPLATASSPTTVICSNLQVQLNGSATGGSGGSYTYAWSGPAGFSSGDISPLINNAQVVNSGLYSVTVTDGNNCISTNTAQVSILVNPRPTATANADQLTICTDQTLQLLGTASAGGGPAYTYQWSGPDGFNSPDQNPVLPLVQTTYSGTYSLTVTDNNTCSSATAATVEILVYPLPVVSFLSSYPDQCYSATQFTLSNGSPAGGSYSGPFVSNGVFNPEAAGIGTYPITYHYTDNNTCTDSVAINVQVIFVPMIAGVAMYDNVPNTLLGDIQLELQDGIGTPLFSETTQNGSGAYAFKCLTDQVYQLEASTTKPSGGVNATDALMAVQYGLGQISLSPLRQLAADVNGNGSVNAGDALKIMRFFANLDPVFPVGNWLFEINNPAPVAGLDVNRDILCICTGDINGSNNPIGKGVSYTELESRGHVVAGRSSIIELPVYAANDMSASAISIAMELPSVHARIIGLSTPLKDAVYEFSNQKLRLAWYDLHPMNLRAGDLVFSLKIETDATIDPAGENNFSLLLSDETEVADKTARPLADARFSAPTVRILAEGMPAEGNFLMLGDNKPNPFNETSIIPFSLSENCQVKLDILDIHGRNILSLIDGEVTQGDHYQIIESKKLPPGIYVYRMKASGQGKVEAISKKMVVTR